MKMHSVLVESFTELVYFKGWALDNFLLVVSDFSELEGSDPPPTVWLAKLVGKYKYVLINETNAHKYNPKNCAVLRLTGDIILPSSKEEIRKQLARIKFGEDMEDLLSI